MYPGQAYFTAGLYVGVGQGEARSLPSFMVWGGLEARTKGPLSPSHVCC